MAMALHDAGRAQVACREQARAAKSMIRLDAVTKRYRRRGGDAALEDVTLHVPAGAVWAVVGPNGAGKSTLLSLTLGFLRPTSGTVSVGELAPRDYLRDEGAGYLPERFSLPPEWRAGSALRTLARLDGQEDAAVDSVVALLGLGAHLDKRAGELSRGLLQRVGLAQALLARRRLIVLDEPTEGLDPLWRIRLRDIVADLRAEGRTVIIASHDLGEVERIADRAVLLDGGRVRDVLDTRLDPAAARYLIRLAAPFDRVHDVFPDATSQPDDAFVIDVSGAHELSERVAALIGLGAVITSVEPQRAALEERVRSALEDGT
jgi:ABC-type multidrug transport system ATPase subunit